MAGRLTARSAFLAICGFVLVLGVVNVVLSDPGLGYDALEHKAYADGLVPGGLLPHGTGEYYTPPGWYAVAGFADWIARGLGVGEPHRAGEAVNVLCLLGTVVLVWKLARELWPGRDRLALGAAAFVAFVPVAERAASMFHPEAMSLFVSTFALWACVRTFRDPRYAWVLGAAVGLGQLVRAWTLATAFVVLVALVVARRWRQLAVVVVLGALIPAPWYVHQAVTYSGNPASRVRRPRSRTPPQAPRSRSGSVVPALLRRPGLPDVITAPYQPHFANQAIPTTYTEIWGDYFGVWAWHNVPKPPTSAGTSWSRRLSWGCCRRCSPSSGGSRSCSRRCEAPPGWRSCSLPAVVLLGYLYFTVSYPTTAGDVLKATYLLTTAPVWALGFGYALERLRGAAWPVVLALLTLCALAELPFLVY